ncbi:MAG TPA: ATP phosphoribosyltransferase [Blastocatellia bacterium]|nr:ATP phosphoribosyltransferase [Blastocatellia bacterium]
METGFNLIYEERERLMIALAKGRLQNDSLALLEKAGIVVSEEALQSRRLLISDETGTIDFILVKPVDVPTYVEYGIADVGICGRDVLLESQPDVHQPINLKIGACRIVVAGPVAARGKQYNKLSTLRVATKYPRITAQYFQERGVPIELIYLSGSVEIAPVLGLSDRIVDLVETGRTLRENGLEVFEVVAESTARLIVNRASYHLKRATVSKLISSLERAL